jgi:hypothetical protein
VASEGGVLDSPAELALGLVTGLAFGFLLQKGRAAKHDVVVGQLLLRDWTLAKILATAIAVGAVGVWAMVALGWVTVQPVPAQLGGVLVGAVTFGVGLAILGYCPATTIVAVGEGKQDARVGLAGMVAGGFLHVVAHDAVAPAQRAIADLGPITWPDLTRSSPWHWIAGVVAIALALYTATQLRLRRRA